MTTKIRRVLVVLAAGALSVAAFAKPNQEQPGRHYETAVDSRYNHNRSYPVNGYVYHTLPSGYATVHYHSSPYYYHGGVWYRPYGPQFVVVAPPIGIGVGFLPPYYTTVWFGGFPYYYADHAYYQWYPDRRQYVVTQPPQSQQQPEVGNAPSADQEVYVYPKNGQSQEQQSTDRYECHAWAVQQSGFDPTRPSGGVAEQDIVNRRAAYHRAEGACLEGRGYSVK